MVVALAAVEQAADGDAALAMGGVATAPGSHDPASAATRAAIGAAAGASVVMRDATASKDANLMQLAQTHLLQQPQLRMALERAQASTTAPIHLAVAPMFWGSVRNFGDAAFRKLAVSKCPERNGALLLIVPRRRQFVVLGDLALHAKVGQRQWDTLAATLAAAMATAATQSKSHDLATDDPYAFAIGQLGRLLAFHYPALASYEPDFEIDLNFDDAEEHEIDLDLDDADALAVAIAFAPADDADTGKHLHAASRRV